MERGGEIAFYGNDHVLNLKATELKLGLPGREDESSSSSSSELQLQLQLQIQSPSISVKNNKRSSPAENDDGLCQKAQVVGWPPVRSYRKNVMTRKVEPELEGVYVKVSMDGAPYLRKIDLKLYNSYSDLVKALEKLFECTIGLSLEKDVGYSNGSEYVPTYEDRDGDWMLVGDVPWDMFATSCRRLRITKGCEAKGLGCMVVDLIGIQQRH